MAERLWIVAKADSEVCIYGRRPVEGEDGVWQGAPRDRLFGWRSMCKLPPPGECWEYVRTDCIDTEAGALAAAKAEPVSEGTHSRGDNRRKKQGRAGSERNNGSFNLALGADQADTRNPRSVWLLSHEPYREAHFATFPSELVRRCLLATTAEQCCSACGMCYAPHLVRERMATRDGKTAIAVGDSGANRDPLRHIQRTRVLGYRPCCECAAPPSRCLVLDPFAGSGTTLQTAVWYGRDAVGCELSTEYAALAEARIAQPPRCLAQQKSKQRRARRLSQVDEIYQYRLFEE